MEYTEIIRTIFWGTIGALIIIIGIIQNYKLEKENKKLKKELEKYVQEN